MWSAVEENRLTLEENLSKKVVVSKKIKFKAVKILYKVVYFRVNSDIILA